MNLAQVLALDMADGRTARLPRLTRNASPEFARDLLGALYGLRDRCADLRRGESRFRWWRRRSRTRSWMLGAGCPGWRALGGMACRWRALRVQGGALRRMGHGWPALAVLAQPAP